MKSDRNKTDLVCQNVDHCNRPDEVNQRITSCIGSREKDREDKHSVTYEVLNRTTTEPLRYSINVSFENHDVVVRGATSSDAEYYDTTLPVHSLLDRTSSIRDCHGRTPLMIALAGRENIPFKTLTQLIDQDVNARDQRGATLLMYAVTHQQDTRIIRYLLDRGADVNLKDDSGKTALDILIDSCPYSHFSFVDAANSLSLKTLTSTLDVMYPFLKEEQKVIVCDYFINRSALTFRKLCEESKELLRWMFRKCIVPKALLPRTSTGWKGVAGCCSPLLSAIMLGYDDVAKYLISIVCITNTDFKFLLGLQNGRDTPATEEIRNFVTQAASKPWSLVKQSLMVVSSAVGIEPDRIARIRALDIPSHLQDMLAFDAPSSALPCKSWQDISPSVHWAT
ncbi:hypothetical protein Btru_070402, partial [Bulinus truncatus]